ncbi:hypothetical protein M8C21_022409 [Ambrosia artemisiifolia]|uniref:Uncharacterized protein n=1 Tax=Ambrosia artemisiifolia TaxID=4212 RepID=A0AAD5C6H5_AMBAR|nr:hypothetical protein M8C21_022409 [Ambrosia artemisiifolia]
MDIIIEDVRIRRLGLQLKAKDANPDTNWEKIINSIKKELDAKKKQLKPPLNSDVVNSGPDSCIPLSWMEIDKDFEDIESRGYIDCSD